MAKVDFYLWKETTAHQTFIKFDRFVFGLNLDVQTFARYNHFWRVLKFVPTELFVLNRYTGEYKQSDSTTPEFLLRTVPRSRSRSVNGWQKYWSTLFFQRNSLIGAASGVLFSRKSLSNKGWSNFGYNEMKQQQKRERYKQMIELSKYQTAVERFSNCHDPSARCKIVWLPDESWLSVFRRPKIVWLPDKSWLSVFRRPKSILKKTGQFTTSAYSALYRAG